MHINHWLYWEQLFFFIYCTTEQLANTTDEDMKITSVDLEVSGWIKFPWMSYETFYYYAIHVGSSLSWSGLCKICLKTYQFDLLFNLFEVQ